MSSCANESQNQRNCLLSSHVIIQLIFNTAKQRYIYSKQTKKSESKDTVIKFLLFCNIRSLCNTAHCSERYVPTTGHCRQNTRINILINGSAATRSIYNFFCTYQAILHCLQLFFKQTFPSSQGGVSDKFKRNFTHYAFRRYIFSDSEPPKSPLNSNFFEVLFKLTCVHFQSAMLVTCIL